MVEKLPNTIQKCYKTLCSTEDKDTTRSNDKTKILHGDIVKLFREFCEHKKINLNNYTICSYNENGGKEHKYQTTLENRKSADIAFIRPTDKSTNKTISVAEVKMPLSNMAQNNNNYIEALIGQIVNCPEGIKFYFIKFVPSYIPYFNDKGVITKIETHKFSYETSIMRGNLKHNIRPDAMFLCQYDFNFDTKALVGKTKEEYFKLCAESDINIVSLKDPSIPNLYINNLEGFFNQIADDLTNT